MIYPVWLSKTLSPPHCLYTSKYFFWKVFNQIRRCIKTEGGENIGKYMNNFVLFYFCSWGLLLLLTFFSITCPRNMKIKIALKDLCTVSQSYLWNAVFWSVFDIFFLGGKNLSATADITYILPGSSYIINKNTDCAYVLKYTLA